ncbi:MAG: DUF5110 domain-containing protein, partial [Alicyclobacillus sp.]|nr:DUF5110 domain-containing protein [Alicyclobacillus sp.]
MAFSSLLFRTAAERSQAEDAWRIDGLADCLRDLRLDRVVEAMTAGRQEYRLEPFFFTPLRDADAVVANAPLPLWPPMRHVGERAPDPLTVLVFPAPGAGAFTLYEDAGEGYAYEQGVYARTPLHCETTETEIVVTLGPREGRYP